MKENEEGRVIAPGLYPFGQFTLYHKSMRIGAQTLMQVRIFVHGHKRGMPTLDAAITEHFPAGLLHTPTKRQIFPHSHQRRKR